MLQHQPHDVHDQFAFAELPCRHVGRKVQMILPAMRFLAHGFQHPLADRHDQARVLGHRNELLQRPRILFGPLPAQQRFEAARLAVGSGHDGLEVQGEAVVLQRVAQRVFDGAAALDLRGHVGRELVPRRAAFGLGAVERQLRVHQQRVGRGAVRRQKGDADADLRARVVAFELAGHVDRLRQPLGQRMGLGLGRDVALQHGEFVAAEPRHQIVLADRLAQPGADGAQQHVAGRVSQGVVDVLEVVQVEQQHGGRADRPGRLAQPVQLLDEQHAVGQAGELVVARVVPGLCRQAVLDAQLPHAERADANAHQRDEPQQRERQNVGAPCGRDLPRRHRAHHLKAGLAQVLRRPQPLFAIRRDAGRDDALGRFGVGRAQARQIELAAQHGVGQRRAHHQFAVLAIEADRVAAVAADGIEQRFEVAEPNAARDGADEHTLRVADLLQPVALPCPRVS